MISVGQFIHSDKVTGKVVSIINDLGDYATNIVDLLVIENPIGERFQVCQKNVTKLEWDEYLDLIGLRYGIFY